MWYLLRVTEIRDKVVLITGATGGIGQSLAAEFAREGARVVVSSRSEDKLQALVITGQAINVDHGAVMV
jgi:NADP-dependent 3-hydroxy acid dehydrogenase YdfG